MPGIEDIMANMPNQPPERPPYPLPAGIDVFPGLMPAQWFVEQAQVGPHVCTVVMIVNPGGVQFSFWPEDSAVPFAAELTRCANLTKAGLYLPNVNGKRPKP